MAWTGRQRRVRRLLLAFGVALAVGLSLLLSGGAPSFGADTSALSPAQRALATWINLKASDLPGFHVGSSAGVSIGLGNVFGGGGGGGGGSAASCIGRLGSISHADSAIGSVTSPDFVDEVIVDSSLVVSSIDSSVEFSTPAAIRSDEELAAKPQFPKCFVDVIAALAIKAKGITITGSHPYATRVPLGLASLVIHPIVSLRGGMTWTVRGVPIKAYVDVYEAAIGTKEITLFAFTLGNYFSRSYEMKLEQLVFGRAYAAIQPGFSLRTAEGY